MTKNKKPTKAENGEEGRAYRGARLQTSNVLGGKFFAGVNQIVIEGAPGGKGEGQNRKW